MRVKSFVEGFAVLLVVLLSGLLIGLIYQYVKLEQQKPSYVQTPITQTAQEQKNDAMDTYLKTLEGYEDVDVEVSATETPSEVNVAETTIEVPNDDITNAIDAIVQEALSQDQ